MDPEESKLDRPSRALPTAFNSFPTSTELTETLLEATRRVLRRRFRVVILIRDAYAHMEANATALTAVWDDLQAALRLLIAWVQRSYREISGASVVLLVAALIYFVTPVDIIPDTLGAIGFVDDIAVIETAVEAVRSELDRFREWEDTKALSS